MKSRERRARRRAVLVFVAGAAWAGLGMISASAFADDARPAATPPPLVAPRPVSTSTVPYPTGGVGPASVLVELRIEVDGRVSAATIVEGPEPFAAAALADAPSWRFEPALRGPTPVVSRIRVQVDFRPPVLVSTGTPDAGAPLPTGGHLAAPRNDDDIQEVTVQGARAEIGREILGAGDVRQMPGAFGDAFRAIDAMPGVTPIVSGLPYYFIRGAPPGNTGYLIDGIRVPLLFHFGVARAVIHPALIDHVDFYPGGSPAKYGRFTGGIIDGQTKAPLDHLHGEWDISLLHAGGFAETPFADGRGSLTVAGRYGYPGLLLSLLAPKVFLQYGDYQARASWQASARDTVSVFAFGSVDVAGSRNDAGTLEDVTSTQFHRVDLRWDHDFRELGHIRTALTLGVDETSNQKDFTIHDLSIGVRTEWEVQVAKNLRVRAGSDAWIDHYGLASDSKGDVAASFPSREDVVAGFRADAIFRVSDRVELVPGFRIDSFQSKSSNAAKVDSAPTFDPRVATRVRATEHVTWISTFGISHQAPSFLVPVPGLQLGNLSKGVQTSVQTSQGFEVALPLEVTLAPTVFLNNYLELSDATATCGFQNIDVSNDCLDQRVRGRTYGLELLLRRPLTKRLTGWVSYTLSRSTREAHGVTLNSFLEGRGSTTETVTILSEFDRTHVLNVIGAYDLGRNWRIGARTVFYTGRPYSDRVRGVAVAPFNTERLPSFFRIDARLEKRWITNSGYVAFVAEGLNVTANKEVLDVNCTPSSSDALLARDDCQPDTKGSIPIIVPLIGVEGMF